MASKTVIANLALSHLGVGLSIGNIDTEKSEEARACKIFFDVALEMILRKKDWSFARKTQSLSYVGPDPTGQWGAMFRYPSDCLVIRRSGYPSQPVGTPARYAIGADDDGTLVYAVDKTSFFTYTYRITTTEVFPADFTLALSYLLAFMVAPRLTGGDAANLGPTAFQAYERILGEAAAVSYNEEGANNNAGISAFERARNS